MTVLIADDDPHIITALKLLLSGEDIACVAADSPQQALVLVAEQDIALALVDMNYACDTTSGMEGLELISALRERAPELAIVVMTGWGSIELAVEAMRRGAADFIEKPWDNNRLLAIIQSQLKFRQGRLREQRLQAENKLLRAEVRGEAVVGNDGEGDADGELLAQSEVMQALLTTARRIAASDISVLITGDNGTGKSLLARYIHRHSRRRDGPMLSVNMGGIHESVFESEMFGHVKGAFTDARSERLGRVELAEQGTLFLDEIANTPLSQQAKLLRLLEERRFEKLGSSREQRADVRLISATNAELDELVEQRGFRRDLLYRLNAVSLHIPALRERPDDIEPLARRFLQRARQQFDSPAEDFAGDTLAALAAYAWPGNVRELHHVVERAVLLAGQPLIQVVDLQLSTAASRIPAIDGELESMTLEQAECYLIERALVHADGQAEAAAQALGLTRSSFYRRLDKHGLGS